ncbi:MAG: MarR family transcriptional regulator [Crocinitomix sp.]|nr:MarR family transcriptional regulator [Crocinitomix sp.]
MKRLDSYIEQVLGQDIDISPVRDNFLNSLPLYLSEMYKFYQTNLFGHELLLVEHREREPISILQTQKHFSLLRESSNKSVVLIMTELTSFNRKRLIEKGINFIVPNKQLFIPDLMMDLRESFSRQKTKREKEKLLPTAQFLLIYHILHRYNEFNIEAYSFKDLAKKLGYTPMAISKAVENLKYYELITVEGGKEKFIRFQNNRMELWHIAAEQNLWINPVSKTVFVDEKPAELYLLNSYTSALPTYSDMNPSRQEYYAIEKNTFYGLQRNNQLVNANKHEGRYALEVWKYNPLILIEDLIFDRPVVDPISLYLSLKNNPDERIEIALEQIKDTFIW